MRTLGKCGAPRRNALRGANAMQSRVGTTTVFLSLPGLGPALTGECVKSAPPCGEASARAYLPPVGPPVAPAGRGVTSPSGGRTSENRGRVVAVMAGSREPEANWLLPGERLGGRALESTG